MVDSAPGPAAPPASQVLSEQRAGNREAALTALKQIRDGAEAPPAVTAQVASAPGSEQVPVTPVEPVEPAAVPAEPVAPVAPEPAAPAEPPGMAALRKQEQHLRRQIAQERAQLAQQFEQERAAWQTKLDAAAAREAKLASARQDPIAALQALGFTEADFDPVGRLIYAASPSGKKDPAAAAAAAQELARAGAHRETATSVAALQREVAELRAAQERSVAQQAEQAGMDRYLATVTKEIGDSTPLARSAWSKNPDRTRNAFAQIADELWNASGPSDDLRDVPTPGEVLAAYEARRSAELEELGIDPKMIGRAAAPASVAQLAAPAVRPGATIAPSSIAAPIVTKQPGPPSREEVLAGLQQLRTVG